MFDKPGCIRFNLPQTVSYCLCYNNHGINIVIIVNYHTRFLPVSLFMIKTLWLQKINLCKIKEGICLAVFAVDHVNVVGM